MSVIKPGTSLLTREELAEIGTGISAELNNADIRVEMFNILTAANPGGVGLNHYTTALPANAQNYINTGGPAGGPLSPQQQTSVVLFYQFQSIRQVLEQKLDHLSGREFEASLKKMQQEINTQLQAAFVKVKENLKPVIQEHQRLESQVHQLGQEQESLITNYNDLISLTGGSPTILPTSTLLSTANFNTVITELNRVIVHVTAPTIPPTPSAITNLGGYNHVSWGQTIRNLQTSLRKNQASFTASVAARDQALAEIIPTGVPLGSPASNVRAHATTLYDNLGAALKTVKGLEIDDYDISIASIGRDNTANPPFSVSINGRALTPNLLANYHSWAIQNNSGDPEKDKLISEYLVGVEGTTPAPTFATAAALGLPAAPAPTRHEVLMGVNTTPPTVNGIIPLMRQSLVAPANGDLSLMIDGWLDDLLNNRPLTGTAATPFNAPLDFFSGATGAENKRYLALYLASINPGITFDRASNEAQLNVFLATQLKKMLLPQVEAYKANKNSRTGAFELQDNAGMNLPNNINDYRVKRYLDHLLAKDPETLSDAEKGFLGQAGGQVIESLLTPSPTAPNRNWIYFARQTVGAGTPLRTDKYRNAYTIANAIINGTTNAVPLTGFTPNPGAPGGLTGAGFNAGALGLTEIPDTYLALFRRQYAADNGLQTTEDGASGDMVKFLVRSILEDQEISGTVEDANLALDMATDSYAETRGKFARHRFARFAWLKDTAIGRTSLGTTILKYADSSGNEVAEARRNYTETLNYKVITSLSDDWLHGANSSKDIMGNPDHRKEFLMKVVDEVLASRKSLIEKERAKYTPTLTQRFKGMVDRHPIATTLAGIGAVAGGIGATALFGAAAPWAGAAGLAVAGTFGWANTAKLFEAGVGKLAFWGRHREETEIKGSVRGVGRDRSGVEGLGNDLNTFRNLANRTLGINNSRIEGPLNIMAKQIATHSIEMNRNRYKGGFKYEQDLEGWDKENFFNDMLDRFGQTAAAGEDKTAFVFNAIDYAINAREQALNNRVETAKNNLRNLTTATDVAGLAGTIGIGHVVNLVSGGWFKGALLNHDPSSPWAVKNWFSGWGGESVAADTGLETAKQAADNLVTNPTDIVNDASSKVGDVLNATKDAQVTESTNAAITEGVNLGSDTVNQTEALTNAAGDGLNQGKDIAHNAGDVATKIKAEQTWWDRLWN